MLRAPLPTTLNYNLAIHSNDSFWIVQKDQASLSAVLPTTPRRPVQTGRLRRGDPTSRGRSTVSPDKSLVVAAVEKAPAPKNKPGKHGHAVKRQHGFFAGNARIAVLPAATGV